MTIFIKKLAREAVNRFLEEEKKRKRNIRTTVLPSGCEKTGCKKRRIRETKLCIEHARPKNCLITDCQKESKQGLGVCNPHFSAIVVPKATKSEECASQRCKERRTDNKIFCESHSNRKVCKIEECVKFVHSKSLCKSHGAVQLCDIPGCKTGSRGRTGKCAAHGGKFIGEVIYRRC